MEINYYRVCQQKTTMKTFKLKPEGFKEFQQKALTRAIPITLLAALAGVYISSVNESSDSSTVDTLAFLIPFSLLILGFGLFLGLKRQKDMWLSYELTIDGETIIRTQNNVPTVTIDKNDLQEMLETRQGDILLKTGQRTNMINIPSSVQDRAELLNSLADFGQINKQSGNKSVMILIAGLVSLGLMLVFFVSTEPAIIIPSGAILTIGFLWSFFEIQRSKLIDKKVKRGSYLIFFLLFSIIGRLVIELKIFAS